MIVTVTVPGVVVEHPRLGSSTGCCSTGCCSTIPNSSQHFEAGGGVRWYTLGQSVSQSRLILHAWGSTLRRPFGAPSPCRTNKKIAGSHGTGGLVYRPYCLQQQASPSPPPLHRALRRMNARIRTMALSLELVSSPPLGSLPSAR